MDDTLPEQALTAEYLAAHADAPSMPPSGGDFHQAFAVNDGSGDVAVVMGDVSGHSPALTQQAENLCATLAQCLSEGIPPALALATVNAAAEFDPEFVGFATVFVGRLEPGTGKLSYCSGGHEPALLVSANANNLDMVQELEATGPPVGMAPADLAQYDEHITTLPEGGTLLLYTDGISDAHPPDRRKDWMGIQRLKALLAHLAPLPPGRLIAKLLASVRLFCQDHFQDDVAVLAVRRRFSRLPSLRPKPHD